MSYLIIVIPATHTHERKRKKGKEFYDGKTDTVACEFSVYVLFVVRACATADTIFYERETI